MIVAVAENERKGKGERSVLPFENALRSYLHGSISRETAERKSVGRRRFLRSFSYTSHPCDAR
jgi:hypothetical protein